MYYTKNENTIKIFNNEVEAQDDCLETMDFDNLIERFSKYVNYETLFSWAIRQENFVDAFDKELDKVNEDFLAENLFSK